MQRARDQFLARAGFAENANPRFAGRDALHLAPSRACMTVDFQTNLLPAGALLQVAGFPPPAAPASRVFSTVINSLSVESGFSRKSIAPSRVARTAISMLAWPETITTGVGTPGRLQFLQQRESVLAGHHHVRKNQVEALRFRQIRARGPRDRRPPLRAPPCEMRAQARPAYSRRHPRSDSLLIAFSSIR